MGAETVKKLETLEAIRGVAALLVLLYHLQDVFSARAGIIPFGGAFAVGDCGVDLFFVLSGFIITTIHAKDLGRPVRLYSFLYKRLCRLLPSVWILTALALMIYTLPIGNIAKLGKLAPSNIAASFMLLPQAQPALVNVTWTLTYEMFFYGLFAVAIVSRPVGLVALACWQLATGLALVGVWHAQTWLGTYYLRPICLEFGIGMICAVIAQHEQLRRRLPVAVLGALLLAGTTLFIGGMVFEDAVHHHLLGPERLLIYGLGPGLLIFGCAAIEFDRQVPVPKLLVWLGTASYAIYLTNYSGVDTHRSRDAASKRDAGRLGLIRGVCRARGRRRRRVSCADRSANPGPVCVAGRDNLSTRGSRCRYIEPITILVQRSD